MSGESERSEEQSERRLTPGEYWEAYGVYPYLLAKLVFWAALGAAGVYVLVHIGPVAAPVFLSLLIAYILNPTVNHLEEKRVPRPVGILLILAGLIAFVVVFSIFLYPTIASQIGKISERAPEALRLLESRTLPWLAENFGLEVPKTVSDAMEQYGEEVRGALPSVAEQVGTWVANAVGQAGNWIVSIMNAVLIPIFTFYFLRDFEKGKQILARFVPPRKEEVILDRLSRMDQTVGQWFRGQVQVSCILAVMYAIGLGAVYGLTDHSIQSGVVIGLLTGFLNVIPYVGFAIGSVLAFLIVLIEWTGWGAILGVALAFMGIQAVEGYYLTPRIVGDKVGLAPVTVIIVLLLVGQVGGLLGILLAIPVTAAVKVVIPDLIAKYHRSSTFSGQNSYPASLVTASTLAGSKRAGAESDPQKDGKPLIEGEVEEESKAPVDEEGEVESEPSPEGTSTPEDDESDERKEGDDEALKGPESGDEPAGS